MNNKLISEAVDLFKSILQVTLHIERQQTSIHDVLVIVDYIVLSIFPGEKTDFILF